MKKWLITYLFIVCGVCLHSGGFASPSKIIRAASAINFYTTTPKVFIFKKPGQVLNDNLPQNNSRIVFHYGSLRIFYPVQSYFTAEPNFYFTTSNKFPVESINKKEIERGLKDHLLHLFPSHYFW